MTFKPDGRDLGDRFLGLAVDLERLVGASVEALRVDMGVHAQRPADSKTFP
ncbi:MAG TPA: hypothetical protein VF128_10265 [Gemmatimonadaceae bacterium]